MVLFYGFSFRFSHYNNPETHTYYNITDYLKLILVKCSVNRGHKLNIVLRYLKTKMCHVGS